MGDSQGCSEGQAFLSPSQHGPTPPQQLTGTSTTPPESKSADLEPMHILRPAKQRSTPPPLT